MHSIETIQRINADTIASLDPPTFIRDDGYIVDLDSGEVLRHEEAPEEFRVRDNATASWVLGKMADTDARIAGLEEERQRRHKQIDENIDRLIQPIKSKQNWLKWRFMDELQDYAHAALEGGKTRTLALLDGCLSFRKSKASVKIVDKNAAVEWCNEHAPDAVKVRTSVDIVTTPLQDIADLPAEIFDVTPAGDRFTVDTGIGSGKWGA